VSTSDPDLVDLELWRKGDRAAGDRLYKKYFPSVYNWFNSRIGGDVADLVQDTFVICVKAKDRFEGRSKFSTWLIGIAKNKLLEHLHKRRGSSHVVLDFSVTSWADLGMTPTQLIRDKQNARLLLEAMRRIGIEHQILLELRYWQGLSIPEVAEVYELNRETMRSRINRAREALVAKLRELENDPVALESTLHTLDDHLRDVHALVIQRFPKLNEDEEGPDTQD
jgi:RNA polymerase sigma factor (sigma-70 family)